MLGSEYNWLLTLSRAAHGGLRVRLVRSSLLTLGVALFGLACVFGGSPRLEAGIPPVVSAPAALTMQQENRTEWPRVALRLWFLLPSIIPHDR